MTEPGPGADRSGGKRADRPEGWGDEWDSVADVIVVGSGVAGMTAAVAAASRGASVIVLERSAFTGGTTAKSGGVLWIPNNSLMRERLVDDRADAPATSHGRPPTRYNPEHETSGSPPTSTHCWRPSTTPVRSPSRSSSPSGH